MANGFSFDPASGNPGINIWSRGPIYPLVIQRRERYEQRDAFAGLPPNVEVRKFPVLDQVCYDVLNADDDMVGFASYDDAYQGALGWLAARDEAELMADLRRDQMIAAEGL